MAGEAKVFYFVITAQKPVTRNMSAKVQFDPVILERGRLADLVKDVTVQYEH